MIINARNLYISERIKDILHNTVVFDKIVLYNERTLDTIIPAKYYPHLLYIINGHYIREINPNVIALYDTVIHRASNVFCINRINGHIRKLNNDNTQS